MNRFSVILAGMFALAGSVALAASPSSGASGGGGGSSGGGGAHGGTGGGGTHSSATAAGWAHSSGSAGSRGAYPGANGSSHMAVELRSHAAARAIAVAEHKPHPNGPHPGHPHRPHEHGTRSAACGGDVDCALWSRADLYCAADPEDYDRAGNDGNRCPHPQRLEIDQRTGLPVL